MGKFSHVFFVTRPIFEFTVRLHNIKLRLTRILNQVVLMLMFGISAVATLSFCIAVFRQFEVLSLMKNLFGNLVLFFALCIAFSNFTACSNTASTQKGPGDETAKPSDSTTESKKGDYPPAPTGVMQAEIKDLEGNAFKIEDKKGKVVIINFWAIWCAPCIAEMPHLVEMQEKYGDKGFEVIGLNAGDDDGGIEPADNIKAFAEKQNLNYQLGYADGKLMNEFVKVSRMSGIPQSLLINREGQLTGVFTGGGRGVINKMKESVEKTMNE